MGTKKRKSEMAARGGGFSTAEKETGKKTHEKDKQGIGLCGVRKPRVRQQEADMVTQKKKEL